MADFAVAAAMVEFVVAIVAVLVVEVVIVAALEGLPVAAKVVESFVPVMMIAFVTEVSAHQHYLAAPHSLELLLIQHFHLYYYKQQDCLKDFVMIDFQVYH